MRIAIGGDISVTDKCRKLFEQKKTKELFGDIPDFFKSCDRVIVNLECAVTDKNTQIKKFGPNLSAPFGTVEVLKEAGVTDCSLSNNHIFDFGKAGLADTIAELEKNDISYTGIGENNIEARRDLIIEGDKTIAVIAVCEHEYSYALPDRVGAREYDPYDTIDDIIEAKNKADYVVVIYHGGKEHCRYPSPRLLKLCRSMVKHGADVVLCQHSHCIGCYEKFMNGHILYGQGNFHFVYEKTGDKAGDMWNTGLLASIKFEDKCSIEFLPIAAADSGIRFAKGKEKERILEQLEEQSRSLQDGSWKQKWHEFCVSNEQWYTQQANPEMKDFFAHYLDCEAHTDVWRELFPTWNATNER